MKNIEELYVARKNGLYAIDSLDEYLEIVKIENDARIGFHDYSIEFLFRGNIVVAVDRDGLEELNDLSDNNLLRYGVQWNRFKKILEKEKIFLVTFEEHLK